MKKLSKRTTQLQRWAKIMTQRVQLSPAIVTASRRQTEGSGSTGSVTPERLWARDCCALPVLSISVRSLTHLCVLGVLGRQLFSWFTDLQTARSYTQGTEPKEPQPSWDLIMDLKPDATQGQCLKDLGRGEGVYLTCRGKCKQFMSNGQIVRS